MSPRPTPGLSAPAAVAVGLGPGLAGGLYDVSTGPGLGTVFAVCFVGGAVLAALLVRRRDLGVTVVLPPLAYVVIALVAGAVRGSSTAGSFVVRQALDLFTALVLEAPALLVATAAALVVALARGLGRRRPVEPYEEPARQEQPSYQL